MGAWIETLNSAQTHELLKVASYMGAWIETLVSGAMQDKAQSHPTWVRGLKQHE